jgi:hypothetical protein
LPFLYTAYLKFNGLNVFRSMLVGQAAVFVLEQMDVYFVIRQQRTNWFNNFHVKPHKIRPAIPWPCTMVATIIEEDKWQGAEAVKTDKGRVSRSH